MADAMLRIARMRIATPACGLVRNDSSFVTRSTNFVAESKITMSLRASAHTGVAIRIPAMHSIASAIGRQLHLK